VFAQDITDPVPSEQHICVGEDVTYTIFGFPGSTIQWYVTPDATSVQTYLTGKDATVLDDTDNFTHTNSLIYNKATYLHQWTAVDYPVGGYTLQMQEVSNVPAACASGVLIPGLKVNIHAKPAINSITPTHIVCAGDKGSLAVSVAATVPALLQLQYRLVNSSDVEVVEWTDDNLTHDFNNLNAGSYNVQIRYVLISDKLKVVKGSYSESSVVTINLGDNVAPTISAAADVVETTSGDGTGNCEIDLAITDAVYGDNCSSSLTWVMTGAVTASGSGQVGSYIFPLGVTTITYTNTDGTNSVTDIMTVTVTDDEDPVILNCLGSNIWSEDFDSYASNTSSATHDGVTWTGPLTGHDRILIGSGRIEAYVQNQASREWTTSAIDISSDSFVSISFDAEAWNANNSGNSMEFQYQIDGSGGFVTFATLSGAFTNQTVTSPAISGSSLKLKVIINRAVGAAFYYFDNIVVNGLRGTDSGSCTYTVLGDELNVTAVDNCSLNSLSYTLSGATTGTGASLNGVVFNNGLTNITWTATDASSNTAACSFTVAIIDNIDPIASNPAGIPVQCISDIPPVNIAVVTDEADNCTANPTVAFVSDINNNGLGTTASPYIVTRTYSVTDVAGNSINVVQLITAIDNINPVTPTLLPVEGECGATAVAPTTTDLCAGTITGTTTDPLTYNTQGTHVITWSFDDGVGDGSVSNPFKNLGAARTVTANGRYYFDLGNGVFQADVDTNEGGGWVLILQYHHKGGTNPTTRVIGVGSDLPVASSSLLDEDLSGTLSWGHAGNAALSDMAGAEELRWYAETSAHSRIIHFKSAVGLAYAQSGTGSFDGIESGYTLLTGGENANLPAAARNEYIDKDDNALTNFPIWLSGQFHWGIKGAGNRWEVDDYPAGFANSTIHKMWVRGSIVPVGNVVTVTQKVIVDDTTDPTASNPPSVTVQCIDDVPAVDIAVVTDEADNCTANPTVAFVSDINNNGLGTTASPYIVTRTYSVTDNAGNSINVVQLITAIDNINPVTPTLLPVTGECSATAAAPTTTDNCAGIITGTTSDPLTYNTQGTHVITWSFDDGNSQVVTVNQNVVINDVTAPVLNNMPANILVNNCSQVVNWVEPTATDNCGTPILVSSHSSGRSFPEGTTTVTYTASDGDNTTEASFTVTVLDGGQAPFICFEATNHAVGKTATQSSVYIGASASRAIDGITDGVYNNNSVTHTNFDAQAWWMVDLGAQEVVDYVNIYRRTDCCWERLVNFYVLLSNTDIGSVSLNNALNDPSIESYYIAGDPGDLKRVLTSGNTARYVKIQLLGTNRLSLAEVGLGCTAQSRGNITATTDAGQCEASVSWDEPIAVDNCGGVTLSSNYNSGDDFPVGTTKVTYTATDGTNVSTSDFDVIVTDNEAPLLADLTSVSVCPADGAEGDNPQTAVVTGLNLTTDLYSDNCTNDSNLIIQYKIVLSDNTVVSDFGEKATGAVSTSDPSGYTFREGTTTVSFKIIDEATNESDIKSFTVTVNHKPNPGQITF
jgi:hypothetical protein